MSELTEVPQIDGAAPVSNPDAQAMSLTGNTMVDLANVAKELGVTLDKTGNVADTSVPVVNPNREAQPAVVTPSPKEPAQPQAAAEERVEVPDKFKNSDGTPNEEKLEKSTKSLEERLAYFKSLEREHSQKQNKTNNPPAPQVVPQAQPQGLQLTDFERRAAIDILNDAQQLGIQMTEQQAILQARADIRMAEAKYAAEQKGLEELRREVGEQRMTAELRDLLQADGDLATPETANRVLEIKQQMGYRTYREAYIQHLGEVAIAQRTGQVKTPTPTGQTAKAPATPVGPVSRVLKTVDTSNPHAMTDDQIIAEIKKLNPAFRGGGSRL